MIKYFNYAIFLFLLIVYITLDVGGNISTSLYSMLPDSQNKDLIKNFVNMESNKKIFITVKGLNKESLKTIKDLEKKISKIDGLEKEVFKVNKKLQDYKNEYRVFLNDLDTEKIKDLEVKKSIVELYDSYINSFFISNIDNTDPLKLFTPKKIDFKIKNRHLVLGDYGYLSIFNIKKEFHSQEAYAKIYDSIKKIEKMQPTMKSFSIIYYFVENSRYIKSDVSKIVVLSTIVLVILYIAILKNISLLLNVAATLISSMIISTIIMVYNYGEISIFVLVFGLSISTIAIDYMFHHYFHNRYENNLGFNKEVFLGFFTTFSGFFILSFTDFLLIKQIAQFSMISLLFSYIIFSFLYQKIGFVQKGLNFNITDKFAFLDYKYMFFISIIVIVVIIKNLNFDFNVRSLNYDNKELRDTEKFFKQYILNKETETIMLKADSIDNLIGLNEKIKIIDKSSSSPLDDLISKNKFLERKTELFELNIKELKDKIEKYSVDVGFKKGYFSDAYNIQKEYKEYSDELIRRFGISIQTHEGSYISYVNISKTFLDDILKIDGTYSLNIKKLFEKNLEDDLKKIIILGLSMVFIIFFILMFISKKNILFTITFLIVPFSSILIYLNFVDVNILHLFMLFIVFALSIDYAIYSNKDNSSYTKKAILMSILSTFGGFGVLVFSNISSLFSIGIVATIGILAIMFLILFQKKVKNVS